MRPEPPSDERRTLYAVVDADQKPLIANLYNTVGAAERAARNSLPRGTPVGFKSIEVDGLREATAITKEWLAAGVPVENDAREVEDAIVRREEKKAGEAQYINLVGWERWKERVIVPLWLIAASSVVAAGCALASLFAR